MPTPITADAFMATGADASTAAELARQHNELAGFKPAAPAPVALPPTATPKSAPLNPMHQNAIAKEAAGFSGSTRAWMRPRLAPWRNRFLPIRVATV